MGPDGCLAGPRGLARALPEQYDLLAVTSCLGIHQLAFPGRAGRMWVGWSVGLPSPSEQTASHGLPLLSLLPVTPGRCSRCPSRPRVTGPHPHVDVSQPWFDHCPPPPPPLGTCWAGGQQDLGPDCALCSRMAG